MAVELLPSVLATSVPQLRRRLRLAQRLSPTIHIDLMDGHFVKQRSVSLQALRRQSPRARLEIHAMVKDANAYLEDLLLLRPRRVYLHVELGRKLLPIMAALRSHHIRVGLAINPTTASARLKPYVTGVDTLLVMAVRPGRYGAPFVSTTPRRIAQLHRWWPKKVIACDGSMNPRTIPLAIKAGARRIIVGSDVQLGVEPLQAWRRDLLLTKKPK